MAAEALHGEEAGRAAGGEAIPGRSGRRVRWRKGPSRQPRAHWALLGLVLFVLAAGLTLDGYRDRALGHSGTDRQLTGGPATLASAGPVLDLSGSAARSVTGAAGTIALTFDDGPDPRWTPRLLAVLAHHHVPATFFVVGSRVLAHPGLVRAELAAAARADWVSDSSRSR